MGDNAYRSGTETQMAGTKTNTEPEGRACKVLSRVTGCASNCSAPDLALTNAHSLHSLSDGNHTTTSEEGNVPSSGDGCAHKPGQERGLEAVNDGYVQRSARRAVAPEGAD